MKFGSVCSGIEAASQAWHPLGWKAQWFSEIEPFPCAVLAHHYPTTPNLGDMTKYAEWPEDEAHAIDLLCGGTPCQSFSVAGLRKGLDDPRGNLMLTFGAIAAKYRPRWLVWENVPGVLSSNGGRDFGTFLGMLGQLGYGFAYRVLDAQYFGLAQRRRRVFVVGCLGDWRAAAAVLFERHSLSGNPAPRRETGQTITTTIRAGASNGGAGHGARSGDSKDELIVPVAGTLQASGKAAGSATQQDAESGLLVAMPHAHISPALKARDYKGVSSDGDGDGDGAIIVPMLAHSLRGEGFDASEDGTGRGTPLVPVAFQTRGSNLDVGDISGTIGTNADRASGSAPMVCFDTTQITSAANRSNPQLGDPCHPLAAGAHAPAIAFQSKASASQSMNPSEISATLDKSKSDGMAVAIAVDLRNMAEGEVAGTLQAKKTGYSLNAMPAIRAFMQVRRLTPTECSRLQGFPDDYLDISYRGKPAADGPKYKSLGNSWAVPNVRWIGQRLQQVDQIIRKAKDSA